MCGLLLDATSSHPDTVLTTITRNKKFITNHGQIYTYMEADMQICKPAIHTKWSDPERWKHTVLMPGGVHTLMSFVGYIGVLMSGTGLDAIVNGAFKGGPNMMNGKAWLKALWE